MEIITDKIQPLGAHNPQSECVRTSCVSHLVKYDFSHLNPFQSKFAAEVDKEDNHVVVLAPTCAGKTVVAELAIAQNIRSGEYKKRAIYLAPMKALAEEKLHDWSEERHSFGNLKIAVLTGDHQMNAQKAAQLHDSHIVVCTSEMLDSKTRNYHSNKWLHDVGVLVVDESHLIGSKGRGPRLETALMRFNENNPKCRIVLMSATVPNANDYVVWLKRMTRRNAVLVKSDYRPCKLNKHFIEFNDMAENKKKRYQDLEVMRMQAALDIVSRFPNDQFLVFAGNKNWGKKFAEILNRRGFTSDFHNADLTPAKKKEIQDDFDSGKIQVLVASSTLAWGVNVNARRVILAHTSYGLEEMDTADIEQACGRAGRIKFHTEGDAYILIPASKSFNEIKRITGGFEIRSKLNDPKTLMFHVVNEINSGKICNKEDLYTWYERSLAAVQNDLLTEETCEQVLNFLRHKRMIRFNEEENKWETTQLGAITSAMYMDPLDVADWFTNFSEIVNIGIKATGDNHYRMEENDIKVCWALANVFGYKPESGAFLSNAEKESSMVTDIAKRLGFMGPQTKVAAVYWYMLKGIDPDDCLRSLHFALLSDLERVFATLKLMHIKYGRPMAAKSSQVVGWKYDPMEWDVLRLRLQYGVQRKYVPLVSLPEIGRVFAERLYAEGICNKQDILNNKEKVISILGLKRAEKLYNSLNK